MRLPLIQPETATGETARLLARAQATLGITPNLAKAMANSPAVLRAYLDFTTALRDSSLPAAVTERIALFAAQANGCDYCLSKHSYIATQTAGLTTEEVERARRGDTTDPAFAFAAALILRNGSVTDEDLTRARAGGLSDAQLTEVVAQVALNLFTNYFTQAARVEIDWPLIHHTDLQHADLHHTDPLDTPQNKEE